MPLFSKSHIRINELVDPLIILEESKEKETAVTLL
jgi:hypothetical protein